VVIAVVWIVSPLLTAVFWHRLMSPLPHQTVADAEPLERVDVRKLSRQPAPRCGTDAQHEANSARLPAGRVAVEQHSSHR